MKVKQYQRAAMRTCNMEDDNLLEMAKYGLIGELGEVAELIKKSKFHGKILDIENLKDELGDFLWYIFVYAEKAGYEMSAILGNIHMDFNEFIVHQNIEKPLLKMSRDIGKLVDMKGSATLLKSLFNLFATFCRNHNLSINEIAEHNVAKLQKRWPDGFKKDQK